MSEINMSTFAKADTGKPKISLVPTQIIRDIARVRMYGDQKYHAPFNWTIVEMDRYKDAMMRHLLAFLDDPTSIDDESGIPHYMHAACNMAFICEMMRPDWEERKKYYYEHDEKLRSQIEEYTKKAKKAEWLEGTSVACNPDENLKSSPEYDATRGGTTTGIIEGVSSVMTSYNKDVKDYRNFSTVVDGYVGE